MQSHFGTAQQGESVESLRKLDYAPRQIFGNSQPNYVRFRRDRVQNLGDLSKVRTSSGHTLERVPLRHVETQDILRIDSHGGFPLAQGRFTRFPHLYRFRVLLYHAQVQVRRVSGKVRIRPTSLVTPLERSRHAADASREVVERWLLDGFDVNVGHRRCSRDPSTQNDAGGSPASKITALVLGWVEDSVGRSDSRGVGGPGSSSKCGVASIV